MIVEWRDGGKLRQQVCAVLTLVLSIGGVQTLHEYLWDGTDLHCL